MSSMADGAAPGAQSHGPAPDPFPDRLEGVVGEPLPPGALLRLAVVARGKWVDTNHFAVLEPDGRLFVAFHDDEGPDVPGVDELPPEPTHVVPPDEVDRIVQLLRDEGFVAEDGYQAAVVEDGEYLALRARIDDREHEVVYEGLSTPAIDLLRRWASRAPA